MSKRRHQLESYLRSFRRGEIRPPIPGKHHAPTLVRDHHTNGHQPELHLYSHTPEQVAQAIMHPGSPADIKEAARNCRKECNSGRRDPENPKLLFWFLNEFDVVFFRGYLADLCYVEVLDHMDHCMGDCETHWRGGRLRDFKEQRECRIRIKSIKGDTEHDQSSVERLHHYLGILLHECCHAVIDLYSCAACESCRSHQFKDGVLGTKGHGAVFQGLAHFLEDMSEGLLGRRLDLARAVSIAHDIAYGDMQMPSSAQLQSWDIRAEKVQQHVKRYR
jgi:hypothetical protein